MRKRIKPTGPKGEKCREKKRKKGEKEDTQHKIEICSLSTQRKRGRISTDWTEHVFGRGIQFTRMLVSGIVRNGKMCDRIANKRDEWSMNAGTRICWTKRCSSNATYIFHRRKVRKEDVVGNETNMANV